MELGSLQISCNPETDFKIDQDAILIGRIGILTNLNRPPSFFFWRKKLHHKLVFFYFPLTRMTKVPFLHPELICPKREAKIRWDLKQSLHKLVTSAIGQIVKLSFLCLCALVAADKQRSCLEWVLSHGLCKHWNMHRCLRTCKHFSGHKS